MPRRGRGFELLIANLERALGSKSVVVTSPEFIKGKSGSTHEIDVTLRGELQSGSIDFLVIIQCRERRQKGDQSWLLQIAKQKEDIEATHAIAVCSAGFTSGAKKVAKENSIALRTIQGMDNKGIMSLYNNMFMKMLVRQASIRQFSFKFKTDYDGVIFYQIPVATSNGGKNLFDPNSPFFIKKCDGKLVSLYDIFRSMLSEELYKNISPNKKTPTKTTLDPVDLKEEYQITTSMGNLDLGSIVLDVDIWVDAIESTLKSVYKYQQETGKQKTLVETAVYELKYEDRVSILQLNLTESKKISINVDNQPILINELEKNSDK